MAFNIDKNFSVTAAKNFILPVLKKIFGGSAFSIEFDNSKVARALDSAGTDIILLCDEKVFGVNSRCFHWQGDYPKTFTIRRTRHGSPAEFFIIKEGMKFGGLTPKFFAQCYSKENLAQVAVIPTAELFNFIRRNNPPVRQNGDVEFYCVRWRDLLPSSAIEVWQVENDIFWRLTPKKITL